MTFIKLGVGSEFYYSKFFLINVIKFPVFLTLSATGKTDITTPKSIDTDLKNLTFPNSL